MRVQEESIFDKIVSREIPADIIFEDDVCLAFKDINPVANTHFLVIPKDRKGLDRLSMADESHAGLLGQMMVVVSKCAKKMGLDQGGFRAVINDGDNGC